MEGHQFEGVCDEDRILCHGLFGTQDSLLRADNRVLFERHYPGMLRMFEGGHRMNDDVVKNVLLPYIQEKGLLDDDDDYVKGIYKNITNVVEVKKVGNGEYEVGIA